MTTDFEVAAELLAQTCRRARHSVPDPVDHRFAMRFAGDERLSLLTAEGMAAGSGTIDDQLGSSLVGRPAAGVTAFTPVSAERARLLAKTMTLLRETAADVALFEEELVRDARHGRGGGVPL